MGARVDRGLWKSGEDTEKLPQRQGLYARTTNDWFFISVGDILFSPRRMGVRAGCVDTEIHRITNSISGGKKDIICVRATRTTIRMKAHPIFLACPYHIYPGRSKTP